MERIALAADLGGTNLRVAAVNAAGEILDRRRVLTPQGGDSSSIVEAIALVAAECLEFAGRTVGFVIAAPGPLDIENGRIIESPNLPELNGLSITTEIEKRLGIPCFLENDATAATIGENKFGASKGYSNVIGVTLGTGVGGGLILDEKPLRGINGMAGEIGHVCVEPNGHPCGCGSIGCIEQYASATAIVRMTKEWFHDYPDTMLDENAGLTSEMVYEAGAAGDRLALAVFNRLGFCLGITLAGLVNVLNPEIIVIGGGVAAGWDLFSGTLKQTIMERAFRVPAEHAKIVRATLGDDAGILGAASLVFGSDQRESVSLQVNIS
jgi:glucokinase